MSSWFFPVSFSLPCVSSSSCRAWNHWSCFYSYTNWLWHRINWWPLLSSFIPIASLFLSWQEEKSTKNRLGHRWTISCSIFLLSTLGTTHFPSSITASNCACTADILPFEEGGYNDEEETLLRLDSIAEITGRLNEPSPTGISFFRYYKLSVADPLGGVCPVREGAKEVVLARTRHWLYKPDAGCVRINILKPRCFSRVATKIVNAMTPSSSFFSSSSSGLYTWRRDSLFFKLGKPFRKWKGANVSLCWKIIEI